MGEVYAGRGRSPGCQASVPGDGMFARSLRTVQEFGHEPAVRIVNDQAD